MNKDELIIKNIIKYINELDLIKMKLFSLIIHPNLIKL